MKELLNNIPFYYEFMKDNNAVKFNLALTLFQPKGNYKGALLNKAKNDLSSLDTNIFIKVDELFIAMNKFNNETPGNREFDVSIEDLDEYRMITDQNSKMQMCVHTDEKYVEEWLQELKPILRERKIDNILENE